MAATAVVLSASMPARAFAQDSGTTIEPFAGGATAIIETHGEWTVSCQAREEGRSCEILQTLGEKESRRPVLTIQVASRAEGAANAFLTLPVGLDLRQGVHIDLDDGKLAATAPFSACTEAGCMTSIDIDREELALFKAGNALQVSAKPADSEKRLSVRVSLKGFASAFERSVDLVR